MNQAELIIKLRQSVNKYNKQQEELYLNFWVLKFTQILILIVLLIGAGILLASLLTPMFMSGTVIGDIAGFYVALTVVQTAIALIIGFFVYNHFRKKRKKILKDTDDNIESLYMKPEDKNNTEQETQILLELSKKKKLHKKSTIFEKFFIFFVAFKETILMFITSLFTPVKPKDYILLDETRLEMAVNLISKLSRHENNTIDYDSFKSCYENFSNTWLNNSLDILEKIKAIKIFDNEDGKKFILLDLEYYDPVEAS